MISGGCAETATIFTADTAAHQLIGRPTKQFGPKSRVESIITNKEKVYVYFAP